MTMTEPTFNGQPITGTRQEQAARLRQAHHERVAALTEAGGLGSKYTDGARHQMIVDDRESTNAAIAALGAAEIAMFDTERTNLERDVLAPPALPLGATATDRIVRDTSFRDARERARATSAHPTSLDESLEALYRDAMTVGDAIQAKATLVVALERGDVDTINAYTEEHPGEIVKVERLYELRQQQQRTLAGDIAHAIAFQGV